MAAAMAKVLRAGSSGSSSSSLFAVMRRRVQQEGVAPLLGSSSAAHAAGASRLMHSGQWSNSMHPGGNGSKLAQQKAFLFGTCRVPSQEHEIMRAGQSSSKRFMSSRPSFGPGSDSGYLPLLAASVYVAITVGLTLPIHFRKLSRYLKEN